MYREILHTLHGYFAWTSLRIRYRINYDKIVLVLSDENKKIDYYALVHLGDFLDRKFAKEAIVLTSSIQIKGLVNQMNYKFPVRVCNYSKNKIDILFDYFSYDKFFDNIVFTHVDHPKDNLLGQVLRDTEINEEEGVCLGLYHLRTVPKLKV